MKTFARIENGVVMEILVVDELPPFHPNLEFVEAPANTKERDLWDGSVFTSPPPPPAPTIAEQLAATDAALPRWGEDIIDALDANGISVNPATKAKTDNKKALRAQL